MEDAERLGFYWHFFGKWLPVGKCWWERSRPSPPVRGGKIVQNPRACIWSWCTVSLKLSPVGTSGLMKHFRVPTLLEIWFTSCMGEKRNHPFLPLSFSVLRSCTSSTRADRHSMESQSRLGCGGRGTGTDRFTHRHDYKYAQSCVAH